MSVLDNALDTDPSSENAVCNPEEGSAKLAGVLRLKTERGNQKKDSDEEMQS